MPTATVSLPGLPTFLPLVFISLLATHSLPLFPSSLPLHALWTFFYVRARGRGGGGGGGGGGS